MAPSIKHDISFIEKQGLQTQNNHKFKESAAIKPNSVHLKFNN